jgi:hypothetical protein
VKREMLGLRVRKAIQAAFRDPQDLLVNKAHRARRVWKDHQARMA